MIDPFRTQYRELNAEEAHAIARIKALASDLHSAIDGIPDGRHKALALTNLEQAVMWAVKSVTG